MSTTDPTLMLAVETVITARIRLKQAYNAGDTQQIAQEKETYLDAREAVYRVFHLWWEDTQKEDEELAQKKPPTISSGGKGRV